MNDKERRLARLEAAAPENWTPWKSIIWDPATGETLVVRALPANRNAYSASPVVADDKLILTREDGHSTVLAWPPPDPGGGWQELGVGDVGETTVATPVCVDGCIFIRTHDSLWCIAAR